MAEESNQTSTLNESQVFQEEDYLFGDALIKHLKRQTNIIKECLNNDTDLPDIKELSLAYESLLFCPITPPKREKNGVCEANPKLNFYPPFMVPELLATYHIFFQNQKIPVSCRANRSKADANLNLKNGACLPSAPTMEEIPKIFEGLGNEEVATTDALKEDRDSVLIELQDDNPRLAVVKRTIQVSHFAYPALNLPPKVMNALMETLLIKKQQPQERHEEKNEEVVISDQQLASWLKVPIDSPKIEEKRKTMMASILITVQLECMQKFFSDVEIIKKIEENIHYSFKHGYVKQASKISNMDLSNLISYMGILHENRLGQSVLHNTLQEEARRDYIRDTIFLYLIYTWQTAMGVWQQCLEEANVNELVKILTKSRRNLWTGFDERSINHELAGIIFPPKLEKALKNGLPDFTSQSMMQNFRSFILERSGILPAMCNALPSDFVPITFKECPPPLWSYTYLFQLANYFMYHSDIAYDLSGEGVLECYCRCNLCTPHRCFATNSNLLSESQLINSFEMQGPSNDKNPAPSLKLTAGMWTSAYLRKFIPEDYHPHEIKFYEDQSNKPKVEPTACVITQETILSQLQEIKKAREKFLLKKGKGVYLDPQTGEVLNGVTPSSHYNGPATETAVSSRAFGERDRERSRKRSQLHLRNRRGAIRNKPTSGRTGCENTKETGSSKFEKKTLGFGA
ncbi:p100k [California sea lion adenovirus 1]|uniref:Shutoff protein n=1 Tax=California sea lion adenovirus 1 TaxID=943083 RepID=A0A059XDH4_9ADEN|nr:p100k [California sea lion adenovirus 1]AIA22360.1 p100k [California sea lion adenovirus 1]